MKKFEQVKVLVFGDVMLDQYLIGKSERISPEAPVPVVNLSEKKFIPGGAGNVAANISALGAEPFLIGVIGDDESGRIFSEVLQTKNVSNKNLCIAQDRPTTVKTRIVANQQQIVRVDLEVQTEISEIVQEKIWKKIEKIIDLVQIIVISDYAKGTVTENLCARLITTANKKGVKILVDPKGRDYLKYKNSTIITPNQKESEDALEYLSRQLKVEIDMKSFSKALKLDALLVTRGEKGMLLYEEDKKYSLKATARNVFDVTGAGDTVIAAMAVSIGAGADFLKSASIANIAAGLSVEQSGTAVVTRDDLENNSLKALLQESAG